MTKVLSYTRSQIILHWLIAALVVHQIVFHDAIEEMWQARMTGAIPNVASPTPHTIVGFLIFLLMIARVWLRLKNGAPQPPESEHWLLKKVAGVVHFAFYLLLLGMPLSGAVAWFGGIEAPAAAHGIAGRILIALVALHVVAALAHQFWFRTNLMSRMSLRGGGQSLPS